jgi:hypothetical protein
MACSVVHVLLPSGKCNAWKCSQHTRPLGARCCGQVAPLWTHSLVGENRSPYLGTSFAFSRTLECPAKNCSCYVPHPNCVMWWERLGEFNFRTIRRMSVSTLRRIYSFLGGVLRVLFAYRLILTAATLQVQILLGLLPFIREKSPTYAACWRHQRYEHMGISYWEYACLWRQLRRCM